MYAIKLYGLAFGIFLAIDALWLGLVARHFYAKHLGYLMKSEPDWIAALLFYLLFIVGVLVFAVLPGLKQSSVLQAVLLGGFFGLCSYATYDLTNLATIRDWPLIVVIVDMVWGTALSATVAGLTTYLAQKIF